MLRISREVYEEIVYHAKSDYPNEACGMVAGGVNTDWPGRIIPMRNVASNPVHYFCFDPREQVEQYNEMDQLGETVVVVYHSHTATGPRPSNTDVAYMFDPNVHYVIVSLEYPNHISVQSFRRSTDTLVWEPISVVEPTVQD